MEGMLEESNCFSLFLHIKNWPC